MRGVARNPNLPVELLMRVLYWPELVPYALHRSWSDEAVRAVAAHPLVPVRAYLAEESSLTAEQRALLLDFPGFASVVAAGRRDRPAWSDAPWLPRWAYERLARDGRPGVRESLAFAPQTPPEIRALVADVVPAPVVPVVSCVELARSGDEWERERAAADPDLPDELVAGLAVDSSPWVRLAVSMRRGLTEAQRAAVDFRVAPSDRVRPARWARSSADPVEIAECVGSAHLGLRRSVACNPHLSAEQVAVLAADEDFAVRLLLCEHQVAVPGELVLRTYREARVVSRGELLSHPAFPRVGLARLAGAESWEDRALVVLDPEAPAELIERLSRDEHPGVRKWVAGDVRLSAGRVVELFAEPETAEAAAASPHLPRGVMERVVAGYGALSDAPGAGAVVFLGRWE